MARPIAPTPALSGQSAVDFIQSLQDVKSASASERSHVFEGANRIESLLTFAF